jgi:membrane protein implicated in regulation of membrane protease activity
MGMEFWNQWWVWASIALALAIAEMLLPGFILLGFAIGAAIVAAIVFFAPPISLFWRGVIFAVLSLIAWIILRNTFKLKTGQVKTFDEDING